MEKSYSLSVDRAHAGLTVKQVMTRDFCLGTGQIKKAKFRDKGITVDGQQVTVRYVLSEGEFLKVLIEDKIQASAHLIPIEGNLKVLEEAEDYIAVEKPAGIVCHPSAGHYCDSMANLIVGYFAKRGEGFVVRLLGRLDKGTSGILLYAKNAPALTALERQRDNGVLGKTYYAITDGCPDWEENRIEKPIGPNPEIPMGMMVKPEEEGGQYALTYVRVLFRSREHRLSLIRVQIATGRTHQIRVHMADEGFPLIGDTMYGSRSKLCAKGEGPYGNSCGIQKKERQNLSFERPMLHAGLIHFLNPADPMHTPVKILCHVPEDFAKVLLYCGFSADACKTREDYQILL